jgi:hypothetical protein
LREGRVYLPPVVAAELLSGKMKAGVRVLLEDFLRELPIWGIGEIKPTFQVCAK